MTIRGYDNGSGQTFRAGIMGFIFSLILVLAAPNGWTQELGQGLAEGARIYYAEGVDFALNQQGGQLIYPAGAVPAEGIGLDPSGTINTGVGSFLEMQLTPSGTVVKLSENTSLVFNGTDAGGQYVELVLLYGRIRVVTGRGMDSIGGNSAGAPSVVIRGGGISCRLSAGDFGVDYMLVPGSRNSVPRPVFRLYAFRGGADVFPYGKGGTPVYFGGAQALSAGEGQYLSVDGSPSYTFAEVKPLGRDISDYWRLHNFTGSPPLPMPDTGIAALPEIAASGVSGGINSTGINSTGTSPMETNSGETSSISPPGSGTPVTVFPSQAAGTGQAPVQDWNKHVALGVGLFLSVSSVVFQGICYSQFGTSNNDRARIYFNAAYLPLGLGLLTTLAGTLYNPSVPTR